MLSMNNTRCWLALLSVLLLGVALRLDGLSRDTRLHGDEALFASYGRLMVLHGDWNLYEVPVDKPPLTFALVGASLSLFGENEFAVRLPNALASLLSLALMFRLGWRVSGGFAGGWLAALLLALSPLDIAYAPTAFQDPPMMTAVLATTLLLLNNRWGWGGFAFGIAFCMKPTAIYLAPLIIVLALLQQDHLKWQAVRHFLMALAIPVVLLVLWDESRLAQSFFSLGNYNNNPGRFVRGAEVWPRLERWLGHLGASFMSPVVALVALVLGGDWLWYSTRHRIKSGLLSWWVVAFSVGYLAWHWLVAFPTYDRYVLPLVPFVLLVVAQGIARFAMQWRVVLVVGVLVLSGLNWHNANVLARIEPNVGADIDTVATLLNEHYSRQIVYDFALGWHLRWYLGSDSSVQVVFWPTPEQLARHIQHDDGRRYLIAPDAEQAQPWLHLLAANGIGWRTVYSGNTVLYELSPPSVSVGAAVSPASVALGAASSGGAGSSGKTPN